MPPEITLLDSPRWTDYDLLDSGDGLKLERFGPYTFARPEAQALWTKNRDAMLQAVNARRSAAQKAARQNAAAAAATPAPTPA